MWVTSPSPPVMIYCSVCASSASITVGRYLLLSLRVVLKGGNEAATWRAKKGAAVQSGYLSIRPARLLLAQLPA